MEHTGMQYFEQAAKLSQTTENMLQHLLELRLTLKADLEEGEKLAQWEKKNKKSVLRTGMFSAQSMWGYLILFFLRAHARNCWSTETKALSFKWAVHENTCKPSRG